MTLRKTSLSRRGVELASGDSLRDMFKTILSDPYDPDTNTEGFVNIGTAENVYTRHHPLCCKKSPEYLNLTDGSRGFGS